MFPVLLSLLLAMLCPEWRFDLGVRLSKDGRPEDSEAILRDIRPGGGVDPSLYSFFRLLNAYRLNDRKGAEKQVGLLTESFEPNSLPRRYQALTWVMANELRLWKDDDLGDIARDMGNAGGRLRTGDVGPATQKIQGAIVAKLDRMIKEAEDAAAKARETAMQQSAPGETTAPMKDSQIGGDSGPGMVDPKRLRGLAEQWGKLPEKERAAATTDIVRDMPPQYREVIERYFKDLARSRDDGGR